jgi:hypothetical protein
MIQLVTLGVMIDEISHEVGEEGGNNMGPRIRQYAENLDPPLTEGYPWCAMLVQFASDLAAKGMGEPNPLDRVRHEALVQSYFDAFEDQQVEAEQVGFGDLVLYQFPSGPDRWNHIGVVARPPNEQGVFAAIEGNTSEQNQRDGDVVARKIRNTNVSYPLTFIRWHVPGTWSL